MEIVVRKKPKYRQIPPIQGNLIISFQARIGFSREENTCLEKKKKKKKKHVASRVISGFPIGLEPNRWFDGEKRGWVPI